MKTAAIIVAAGSGRRMKTAQNKIFLKINGKPIITRSLMPFLESDLISQVILVIRKQDKALLEQLLPAAMYKRLTVVYGGATRTASVTAGFAALADGISHVLIHDGARPFVDGPLIGRIVDALAANDAVIPVLPLIDTVKVVADNCVVTTPSRDSLRAVQTPQAFSRQLFERICDYAKTATEHFSDDASIAETLGEKVYCVAGDAANIKLTTGQDLALAETIIKSLGENK